MFKYIVEVVTDIHIDSTGETLTFLGGQHTCMWTRLKHAKYTVSQLNNKDTEKITSIS